jgi:AcrR family transcriptional regulator
MARKTDPTDKIVDATLELIAERGWRAAQPDAIAARAGVDLATLYKLVGGRMGVLDALTRRIDVAMLAGATPADPNETPHDLLFDTLMRRFDALKPYKPAILVLMHDWRSRPLLGLAQAPAVVRSMGWALAAAGIPVDGLGGAALTRALAVAYAATLRVWLGDDSPDLGRTMAALDRSLRRLHRLSPMLRTRTDASRNEPGGTAEAAA